MATDRQPRPLTARQMRFMAEYIKDSNATQASIRVGIAPANAAKWGSAALKHPEIRQYVADHRAAAKKILAEHSRLTSQKTQTEMATLAYFDPRRLVHPDGTAKKVSELDDIAAAAIAGFTTRVEWVRKPGAKKATKVLITGYTLHNKIAALDMAAKVTGEYAKDNAQRRPARELSDDELEARILEIDRAAKEAQAAINKAQG